MLDEPSTEYRTNRGRDRGEAGPRPDRPPTLFLGKISADESQAAGYQQRPSNALETPRDNKLPDVRRQSAPGRGYREQHDTGREDLAAAVEVPERSANEEQRSQKESVRFHDP